MKSVISLTLLALATTVQSAVLPRTTCTKCAGFTISVSGGPKGTLGQLPDGQNRVGPDYKNAAKYTLGCDGGITDGNGRGCILTPPTTQFQCDVGATPTKGFTIGSNGQILTNGSGTFYACPVDDKGNFNIYSKPVANQPKCVKVTLTANGCAAPPPAPAPPKTCPASTVNQGNVGKFEFPHLIVPVNSASPNTAYGTQYFAHITPQQGVIFNFDIPATTKGTCSLIFRFPKKPLVTSDYTVSGAGNFQVVQKQNAATQSTTYANQGGNSKDFGTIKMSAGNDYTISTFPCPSGQRIAYEISSKDTDFNYFQDYNQPAIGLYIVPC